MSSASLMILSPSHSDADWMFPSKSFHNEDWVHSPSPQPPSPPTVASSTPSSPLWPSLLFSSLHPVRSLIHRFLTDEDAARLLRTSASLAHLLLRGFSFTSHVFEPVDLPHLHRLTTFHSAYDLRPTLLMLPRSLRQLDFHPVTGLSPFPASLTTLALGEVRRCSDADRRPHPRSLFGDEGAAKLRRFLSGEWAATDGPRGADHFRGLLQADHLWEELAFEEADGNLECALPPGLLPPNLRVLQTGFNCAVTLVPGSLPAELQFLQLGGRWTAPLPAGVLPAGLKHLILPRYWSHPLPELPPSLVSLHLGPFYAQPLRPLPASLRMLVVGEEYSDSLEGVLPAGLTHLLVHGAAQCPLSAECLPPSLVSLLLGDYFKSDAPLRAGQLPAGLRELSLGASFTQPLMPGSLPESLEFLRVGAFRYPHALGDLVLPSRLQALDLLMGPEPMAGTVIPPSVRWLRVREECRAELQAPGGGEVQWWSQFGVVRSW